jgi:hypothetical protein
MNREEIKAYILDNYAEIIKESDLWILEASKKKPKTAWTKRAAKWIPSVATIIKSSLEILLGTHNKINKPDKGSIVFGIVTFQELFVGLNYKIILVNKKVQLELNNIDTGNPLDTFVDDLIFNNQFEIIKKDYVPAYLEKISENEFIVK